MERGGLTACRRLAAPGAGCVGWQRPCSLETGLLSLFYGFRRLEGQFCSSACFLGAPRKPKPGAGFGAYPVACPQGHSQAVGISWLAPRRGFKSTSDPVSNFPAGRVFGLQFYYGQSPGCPEEWPYARPLGVNPAPGDRAPMALGLTPNFVMHTL